MPTTLSEALALPPKATITNLTVSVARVDRLQSGENTYGPYSFLKATIQDGTGSAELNIDTGNAQVVVPGEVITLRTAAVGTYKGAKLIRAKEVNIVREGAPAPALPAPAPGPQASPAPAQAGRTAPAGRMSDKEALDRIESYLARLEPWAAKMGAGFSASTIANTIWMDVAKGNIVPAPLAQLGGRGQGQPIAGVGAGRPMPQGRTVADPDWVADGEIPFGEE